MHCLLVTGSLCIIINTYCRLSFRKFISPLFNISWRVLLLFFKIWAVVECGHLTRWIQVFVLKNQKRKNQKILLSVSLTEALPQSLGYERWILVLVFLVMSILTDTMWFLEFIFFFTKWVCIILIWWKNWLFLRDLLRGDMCLTPNLLPSQEIFQG